MDAETTTAFDKVNARLDALETLMNTEFQPEMTQVGLDIAKLRQADTDAQESINPATLKMLDTMQGNSESQSKLIEGLRSDVTAIITRTWAPVPSQAKADELERTLTESGQYEKAKQLEAPAEMNAETMRAHDAAFAKAAETGHPIGG